MYQWTKYKTETIKSWKKLRNFVSGKVFLDMTSKDEQQQQKEKLIKNIGKE